MNGVELHAPGIVHLCYGIDDASTVLVSCGNGDSLLKISDVDTLEERNRYKNKTPFVSCAHAPQQPLIVTGDTSNLVKSFWRGDFDYENTLTRLTLFPLCLAFHPNGKILAAAGDCDGIKLIEVATKKLSNTLWPRSGVRGLSFDPKGIYLLVITGIGNIQIWDLDANTCIEKKISAAQKVGGQHIIPCGWFPKTGEFFCLPGANGDISFYKRDSWERFPEISLPDDNYRPIRALAFSPNGAYLASGGEDGRICVYRIPSGEKVAEKKTSTSVIDIAWNPKRPHLAFSTETGMVYASSWETFCPSSSVTPIEDIVMNFRPHASRTPVLESESEEDSVSDHHGLKRQRAETEEFPTGPCFSSVREIHAVVRPGSTEKYAQNKPFFFCWNYAGRIVVQSSERNSSIQILPKGFKVPPFLDFSGHVMGTMSENGALFVSPGKSDASGKWKNAKLEFKAFRSWAQKPNWEQDLLFEEQPICIATGDNFCAVVTSKNLMRLFTTSGWMLHIIQVPPKIICLTARGNFLAFLYQTANQDIHYKLYNVARKERIAEGSALCTKLKWAGFSSKGCLCIMDSSFQMHWLTAAFGGEWIPIFNGKQHLTDPTDDLFVIEVGSSKVTAIVHKSHTQPQFEPPSILTDFEFDCAVLEDTGRESEIMLNILVSELFTDRCAVVENDQDSTSTDKMLLELFNDMVKRKEETKAWDIVQRMKLLPYIEGALKLANYHRLSLLAQKITDLLEAHQNS